MYENNSNGYNNGNTDWNNGNNNWNNGNTNWNNGNTDWNNGYNNNYNGYNGYNGYGKQKKLNDIFNGILKMLGAIVLLTSVLIIGVIIYAFSLEKMHEPRVTDDGLKGRGVTIEINGDLNDWSVLESDIYVTFKGPEVKGPKDEVSNVTIGYYIQNIRTTKKI